MLLRKFNKYFEKYPNPKNHIKEEIKVPVIKNIFSSKVREADIPPTITIVSR